MKSLWKSLIAATLIAAGSSSAFAEEDKQITLGTMAWEDLKIITLVAKNALEQEGYTVDITEFSEWGIAYAALSRGDVEAMVSQTDYVAQDYWDRSKRGLEKLSVVSFGLYQAFAVPSYVEVSSVEELNENAELFNDRIIGVEPGSGLMREASLAIEEYGLDLQLVEGSTAGMTAALDAAVSRQEPIVVALWEPSWMFQKYGVKFLEDPEGVFAPPQAYHMIAHKDFSTNHPQASELLSGIFVPVSDISKMAEQINEGQTVEQAAQGWIDANADLMGIWANIKDY